MKFDYQGKSHAGGVYRIVNTKNGRIYIGSCKEFKRRSKQHHNALMAHTHSNKYLQADYNNHASDDFIFEILEIVIGEKQDRTDREQVYISRLYDGCQQCYNMSKNAASSEGRPFSNTPEETRKKMSEAAKARLSDPANHPLYGKKFTDESRQKMSDSHKGQIPSNVKTHNVTLQSPTGELVGPIYNLHQFCRDNELSLGTTCLLLAGKRSHHKGWKIIDDNR
jgi:group I intron endonuclease